MKKLSLIITLIFLLTIFAIPAQFNLNSASLITVGKKAERFAETKVANQLLIIVNNFYLTMG
ncbi:hypothetical protein B6N60_01354 [Richelia sinica FACHB-800]|uniref:Uncharacterized protein n=1 Tax=Richelia sinica FACHB-800 TaxID=1357546 RepID=A0A975T5P7_9NOST|nr:hypothetical protein B6N60_01354 [Richelia sinica FACHB-800]